MGKQQKPDPMHKVYRQFSRQKYNKYKHQYPKMRESEIVSKIIREWDSLGAQGKQQLQRIYQSNKFIQDDHSEQDSGYKSVEKVKIEKSALENTQEKSATVKIQTKEEGESGVHLDRYALSERSSSKKSLDSGHLMTPQSKNKKSNSLGKNDYLAFFKHYYAKYKKEHEKWSPDQISKMISLLWAKRKKQYRVGRSKKEKLGKPKNVLSGKKLFRKVNKLNAEEANSQWNRLPRESRSMLYYPDKQRPSSLCKIEGKMVLKSLPTSESSSLGNIFSFLNRLMT